MRYLLWLYIVVVTFCDVSGLGLGILPGLSLKNVLLYAVFSLLVLQVVVGEAIKVELREILVCFGIFLGYAMATWVIAATVIEFPQYKLLPTGMDLKAMPFDWMIMFVVFFYATHSAADAKWLINTLLLAVSAANLITIATVGGLMDIGAVVYSTQDDRISGSFGHANETGTMIACLLPAYIAAAESNIGWRRALWITAMMISLGVLVLTQSRGALVGLFLGGIWAAMVCHRYLSMERAMRWLTLCAGVLLPVLAFVGFKYWHQLVERFTGSSTTSAADLSSGRTDIWARAIAKMMDYPITLLTGFGWDVWSVMGFHFVAHNEYLSIWFELGIVGVVCFIFIFYKSAKVALAAAAVAEVEARRYMVAFFFSVLILCTGMFFATFFTPWLHVWPYVALFTRWSAVISRTQGEEQVALPATSSRASVRSGMDVPQRKPIVAASRKPQGLA